MTLIMQQLRPALMMTIILTVVLGLAYPLAITGIAQAAFPHQANGSLLYDADERYHRHIVEASAGPRLLALHDAVKPQAERYIRMYISMLTGDIRASVYEHDIIIAAIDEGRADDAELAVQVNWRHAADRLSKVIAMAGERGSW